MLKNLVCGVVIILLTIFNCAAVVAQTVAEVVPLNAVYYTHRVYKDLGIKTIKYFDGSLLSVHVFIIRSENVFAGIEGYKYKFTLIGESLSEEKGELTSTLLFGIKVFIRNVEEVEIDRKEGRKMMIDTIPTSIYSISTNDEHIEGFYLTWDAASYLIKE